VDPTEYAIDLNTGEEGGIVLTIGATKITISSERLRGLYERSRPKPQKIDVVYFDEAHRLFGSDEIEFDAHPEFSRGQEGTWVSAWVRVPPQEEAPE
jgi:hypothetical protein